MLIPSVLTLTRPPMLLQTCPCHLILLHIYKGQGLDKQDDCGQPWPYTLTSLKESTPAGDDGAQLVGACLAFMKSYARSPVWDKLAVVTHVCHVSTQKVESEVLGVQGQPWQV